MNQFPEAGGMATTYGDCESAESENVAKTVAISAADPRLIGLVERWESLPQKVRTEIIRLVDHAVAGSEILDPQ